MKVKRVIFVKANWCPHCRASEQYVRDISDALKAEAMFLDIDNKDQEKLADEIVKKYGDWSPDYLIPQVFLEFQNGEVKHIITGDPRGVQYTIERWKNFLASEYYRNLVSST
ncbi:MAG TPA: thioredoxin family protein [Geobacterales bacterium]|nr:thioredoxin family protein [Geobacterales bacterium]